MSHCHSDHCFRVDVQEIKAHTQFDIDSNGEVTDEEAKVVMVKLLVSEPRHEKTCFLHNCTADQRLCFFAT